MQRRSCSLAGRALLATRVLNLLGMAALAGIVGACGGDQSGADDAPVPSAAADPRLSGAGDSRSQAAANPDVAEAAQPPDHAAKELLPAGAPATKNLVRSANPSGFAATFSLSGVIDRSGPFFQSLGSNGRSCASCHVQEEGWSITPAGVQQRFERTRGLDPIFRVNDGSNSPLADVSSLQSRRDAFSMLLRKGLIRVGIGIPEGAEFVLQAVDDPYGFASEKELSLFRRPLPSTNLKFLSTVMWDARKTLADPASADCIRNTTNCFATIHFDLSDQADGATTGHAQAAESLTLAQREAIVAFETGLFTAQVSDHKAGALDARGARGGPVALSQEQFYFGINDTLVGDYRTNAPFTATVMTLYDAWADVSSGDVNGRRSGGIAGAKAAIARGQKLFNSKSIAIRGVKGLNDELQVDTLNGTCSTCHNAPNAGNHSIPMPLDIGVSDAALRSPDMPLYTLRNKTTGETVETTDPGRALVTGKWNDIGRFKGPTLRGLAGRAPYFHNGSAASLEEAVAFYNKRFGMGLTQAETGDLAAFLRAL